jgi:hypothetical protein
MAEGLMQRYCQEVGELVGLMEEVPPLQTVTTRLVEVGEGRDGVQGWVRDTQLGDTVCL